MREREELRGGKTLGGEKEKSDLIESLPRITRSRKLKPTIQVSCEPNLDRAQVRLSPRIQLWGRTTIIYY